MRQYALLEIFSRSVEQASHQPFTGPTRRWLVFAARSLAAWYCYFAGVAYPWGRFSPALLSRFRSWQWQPDGPSRVQTARLAKSLQARDDNERRNLFL